MAKYSYEFKKKIVDAYLRGEGVIIMPSLRATILQFATDYMLLTTEYVTQSLILCIISV